jgi:hypothetical protein
MFWGHRETSVDNAMTRISALVAVSIIAATGLFWAGLSISAPVATEALNQGIDVSQIGLVAYSKVMPSFEDMYQRHTGVLDVLPTPRWPPYEVHGSRNQGEINRE